MIQIEKLTNPAWGKSHAKSVAIHGASFCRAVDETGAKERHVISDAVDVPTCIDCRYSMIVLIMCEKNPPAWAITAAIHMIHDWHRFVKYHKMLPHRYVRKFGRVVAVSPRP